MSHADLDKFLCLTPQQTTKRCHSVGVPRCTRPRPTQKAQPAVDSQSQLSSMERDTSLHVSPCLNGGSACATTRVSGKKRKTFVGADISLAALSQKVSFKSRSRPVLFLLCLPFSLFAVSSPAICDPAPQPAAKLPRRSRLGASGLKGGP